MSSDNYLPPLEPSNNAPEKKSARRTMVLWFGLVLSFVLFYNVFSEDAASLSGYGFVTVIAAIALLGVGVFVFLVWREMRRARSLNHRMEPAMMAALDNDYEKAERVYRELIDSYRGSRWSAGHVKALLRHNLADSLMHQGRLQEAIDEMVRAERSPGLQYAADVRLLASLGLVKLFSLRGETDAAEKWLSDSKRRLTRSTNRMDPAAVLSLAEATLLCRSERFDEAINKLERNWSRLENSLAASTMQEARLLRGYAVAKTASPRDSGLAEPWLGVVREDRAGRLRYLAAEWPALGALIDNQAGAGATSLAN